MLHSSHLQRCFSNLPLVPLRRNCPDDYYEQPEVLNGCSSLMAEVFGPERGPHSRSAVGTNVLPRNVPVEIEMIAEVEE